MTFADKWAEVETVASLDDPREQDLIRMIKFFFYAGAHSICCVMQNSMGDVEQAEAALKEVNDFMNAAEAEAAMDGFKRVARSTTIQ